MAKYLIKTSLFILLVIVLLQLIKSSVPFYWGNRLFAQKIEYIKNSNEDFNCFFIGSSVTRRHIAAEIVNENTGLQSYNLGTGSQYNLETTFLIENLVNKLNLIDNDDLIIFDRTLPEITDIADVNLHTTRSKYYLDFKRLKTGLQYYIKQKNFNQVYNHLLSYFENQLCIGGLLEIFRIHFTGFGSLPKPEYDQLGFYSMDQHQEFKKSWWLKQQNEKFLNEVKNGKYKNRKKKDIKIEKIETEINHKNIYINKGNPIIDNNLYFDNVHYNLKGAKKYSNLLVKELEEICY